MKSANLVLLLPWHSVDLVRCKPLVKEFNDTVVDPIKEEFALQLQLAFEEVDHLEEFANIGLFSKTSVQSSNRQPCANIGENFKSCNLTGKQLVSKEKNRSSLGPVGGKMTMKPDGV